MLFDNSKTPGCMSAPAFFVYIATSLLFATSLSARTLIFESDQQTAQSANASASQVVSAAPVTSGSAVAASANSELFFMIEELQAQVKTLRGMIEEQGNEIRHLKRNAKARYLDLDTRLLNLSKKEEVAAAISPSGSSVSVVPVQAVQPPEVDVSVETPASAPTASQAPAAPPKVSSPAEKAAYQEAYSLIKEKKFDEAVGKFYAFIEEFPDGALTANAYYWLGEVYLVLPKLEQARQAFSIVVKAYPDHSKVADSLFKLGVAYDRLQNPSESQKYLTEVQKRFPNSTAAKLAKSYKINR